MKKAAFVLLTLALYVLHQDFWLWCEAEPLFLGILPVGLAYHAAHTLASSILLWLLVMKAWPADWVEPGS